MGGPQGISNTPAPHSSEGIELLVDFLGLGGFFLTKMKRFAGLVTY